ncbi:6931_t:CDS:1 [Acaulospora morrowiae]|uniref:6931_t:CDS:1 n=1 Tax=Acaulospora morrowiae TaxID=94023 RepID=A0A9N8W6A7_9GLOM|nr:6931_t:CDS:1 [Acaulospora morrowiae]
MAKVHHLLTIVLLFTILLVNPINTSQVNSEVSNDDLTGSSIASDDNGLTRSTIASDESSLGKPVDLDDVDEELFGGLKRLGGIKDIGRRLGDIKGLTRGLTRAGRLCLKKCMKTCMFKCGIKTGFEDLLKIL